MAKKYELYAVTEEELLFVASSEQDSVVRFVEDRFGICDDLEFGFTLGSSTPGAEWTLDFLDEKETLHYIVKYVENSED